MLVEPSDLKLSIYQEATDKLTALKEKLTFLQEDLDKLSLCKEIDDIPVGSRVLVYYENGSTCEGRVWGKKKSADEYQINRDGYKSYMNFPKRMLKNLSVGTVGKLERDLWLTQTLIYEYEKILDGSEVHRTLLNRESNIVEIVKIESVYPCDIVDFVLSYNLQSGRLKIPIGIVTKTGFYDIKLSQGNVLAP